MAHYGSPGAEGGQNSEQRTRPGTSLNNQPELATLSQPPENISDIRSAGFIYQEMSRRPLYH